MSANTLRPSAAQSDGAVEPPVVLPPDILPPVVIDFSAPEIQAGVANFGEVRKRMLESDRTQTAALDLFDSATGESLLDPTQQAVATAGDGAEAPKRYEKIVPPPEAEDEKADDPKVQKWLDRLKDPKHLRQTTEIRDLFGILNPKNPDLSERDRRLLEEAIRRRISHHHQDPINDVYVSEKYWLRMMLPEWREYMDRKLEERQRRRQN